MNLIERDMLTRCLGPIYEQMLMGDTDAALASIEGVTWLVRYMAAGKSSQRATLENELRAVRAVFQICRGEVGLETGVSGLDPYLEDVYKRQVQGRAQSVETALMTRWTI